MKYGFYVSGNAGRLRLYLNQYSSKENLNQISFVLIDNKDNEELRKLCSSNKIPFYEYSYKELGLKFKEQNKFISEKLFELLKITSSSYCFIFGGRILEGQLLKTYENKLINFHPSLLPAYKGSNAIDQALNDGSLLLGNTAHFIDEELDAGITIMQSIIPAKQFENYETVLNMQVPMIHQIVKWIESNRLIVKDSKVEIINAQYNLTSFIPNLENYE